MNRFTNSYATCKLTLTDRKGEHHFLSSDIIRMQATSSYTILHVKGRPTFMIAKVLKVYEALLAPYGFVRTHRSHLVNRQYIQRIEKRKVVMQDESIVSIARNKNAKVIRQLQ